MHRSDLKLMILSRPQYRDLFGYSVLFRSFYYVVATENVCLKE